MIRGHLILHPFSTTLTDVTSHSFREHIWSMGARPAIPPQRHEASVSCPSWIYNNRNQVERLWARLKEWRAVATRYEKTANCDWLKR